MKVVDHTQDLCTSRQALIFCQLIQFLEGSLYLVPPPDQLHEFLCVTLSIGSVSVTAGLLKRPCLICLVARASTESSSTMILIMIPVTDIISVGGIFV